MTTAGGLQAANPSNRATRTRIGWYVTQALADTVETPDEAARAIADVTRERMIAAARGLAITCEFRLMPNGEAEEGGGDGE